jgi:hypothetical protein
LLDNMVTHDTEDAVNTRLHVLNNLQCTPVHSYPYRKMVAANSRSNLTESFPMSKWPTRRSSRGDSPPIDIQALNQGTSGTGRASYAVAALYMPATAP